MESSKLDPEIARRSKVNELARRPLTAPGIEPLIESAIAILALLRETLRHARDFVTWQGLTPRHHSLEGKQRFGAKTKMG